MIMRSSRNDRKHDFSGRLSSHSHHTFARTFTSCSIALHHGPSFQISPLPITTRSHSISIRFVQWYRHRRCQCHPGPLHLLQAATHRPSRFAISCPDYTTFDSILSDASSTWSITVYAPYASSDRRAAGKFLISVNGALSSFSLKFFAPLTMIHPCKAHLELQISLKNSATFHPTCAPRSIHTQCSARRNRPQFSFPAKEPRVWLRSGRLELAVSSSPSTLH